MKSVSYAPVYIYIIAIILALPATWLVVGRSGEDVPGIIAMIVTIVSFGTFALTLGSLHRRLQNRRYIEEKVLRTIFHDTSQHLTNRWPVVKSPFDFMKGFSILATLAATSDSSAYSR